MKRGRGIVARSHCSDAAMRDCRLRGPVLSVPPVPLSFKIQTLSVAMRSQAIRDHSCAAKAAFVTGGAMKPAGLAVPRTRRPAKPGRGADTAAPSRHQATHRHVGLVVARSANRISRYIWNRICVIAAILPCRVFVHKSPVAPRWLTLCRRG